VNRPSRKSKMIVAGVMSGTSADGVNVALVQISEDPNPLSGPRSMGGQARPHRFKLLGHAEYSHSKKVRTAILAAMNASQASVPDLARLNFLLGELYSDALLTTQSQCKLKIDLVGCHGQTLYHQGEPQLFLGRKVAGTWQTGEAAIIAARVGAPVISDFRPADIAAGGHGAPLVPLLDYLLFRDARLGRIVQNIGGIANLTMIPAGASPDKLVAFDTGPGNMVIDAVTEKLFGQPFDRGGRIAASGEVKDEVIHEILRQKFFRRKPPKTAGREEFGREFVDEFLKSCKGCRNQDVVATATALTARSIAAAVQQYSERSLSNKRQPLFHEMILSGGGAKNATLVSMLGGQLARLGLRLRFSDEFGLPSAAKEAVAFAVLAYQTWHRRPSNVPSATGAKRSTVLGKISYP
jgi:anhydro-N-acetylmuramic acid kinase